MTIHYLGAIVYSVLYVTVYWIIYRIKKSKDDLMFYGFSAISVSPEHASLTISFLKQVIIICFQIFDYKS